MKRAEQTDLFARRPADPMSVGHVPGSDTSRAAAVSMAPLTGALRLRVYAWATAQADGFTCDAAELALDLKHQTCSARIRELVQLGYLVDTGRRENTSSGRPARVYETTDKDPA